MKEILDFRFLILDLGGGQIKNLKSKIKNNSNV